jgi:integrase
LRSRAKSHPADFRTGTTSLKLGQQRAKEWLAKNSNDPVVSRKGGGTLEGLVRIYLTTPKRTKANVAKNNVSRLRVICRLVFEKELADLTCRQVGPDFWQDYQRIALERAGHEFDLVTRRRENIAINAATRAARCLFLPALIRAYAAAGLDVNKDAGQAVPLPVPYVPPTQENDEDLIKAWAGLRQSNLRLWLAVGLARFGGLRREEINASRGAWVEEHRGVVSIMLRDRPEEKFWTKTGRSYRAQIIHPELAEYLLGVKGSAAPIVPDPPTGDDRGWWFERDPQEWLHANGIISKKPLHRLRGLYADHIANLTSDAVAARLAGIRAAQENLGHTNSSTTENHYLSPDALR